MKRRRSLLIGAALLLVLATANAQADGRFGRWRGGHPDVDFGFYFGLPWLLSPFYYPNPYPPVVVYREPPVVVSAPPPPAYWYYCTDPRGYYPYVRRCPPGWMEVAPQPPAN